MVASLSDKALRKFALSIDDNGQDYHAVFEAHSFEIHPSGAIYFIINDEAVFAVARDRWTELVDTDWSNAIKKSDDEKAQGN